MYETRVATVADAETIAEHRYQMFLSSGQTTPEDTATLRERFTTWVRPRLSDGSYVGWMVEAEGRVIAGAGLWLMDFPPHFLHPDDAVRAYLLNFYVEDAFRGHGLAGKLLQTSVDEARRRGAKVVTLHASKFGKPIYERFGFTQTNEMMLRFAAE
jgi:GNAT superfamily N-acetyltransferase